jgi:hypothetical protein
MSGFEASCSCLSLPVSMLVNAGFFPFGVTRMGIWDTDEGVVSCLGIRLMGSIEWESLD